MLRPCIRVAFFVLAIVSIVQPARAAEFAMKKDAASLTVLDGAQPVLISRFGPVEPPEGVDKEKYRRACYIHPLFDLDGVAFTEDFPAHHHHQRGVFWAWPEATLGGRRIDTWALEGTRPHFAEWIEETSASDHATVGVKNFWKFDGEETPIVEERVFFTVRAASDNVRSIDFDLTFKNLGKEPLTLKGAIDKGYGGFGVCPDTKRKPFVFHTKDGVLAKDALQYATPWADVALAPDASGKTSGVAIFQHPGNPGYPHDGWMFREYGYLGAAWPHEAGFTLQPEESVRLRYRLVIHRGTAEAANVATLFQQYESESKP